MSKKHQYRISKKRTRQKANRAWRRKEKQRLRQVAASSKSPEGEPKAKPKKRDVFRIYFFHKSFGTKTILVDAPRREAIEEYFRKKYPQINILDILEVKI